MLTLHSKAKPGSVSCTLTAAELQKYPDSLLSSIAASCATSDDVVAGTWQQQQQQLLQVAGSSSSSIVSINLEEVPGWPSSLLKPVDADVLTAMYRDGHFPITWLEEQLAAAGSSSSSSRLYKSLEGLLSYLILPGTVLTWLPIDKVTLRHIGDNGPRLQSFYYKAAALQAAQSMSSYSITTFDAKQRVALFLITATGDSSKPLDVWAVGVKLSSSDMSNIAAQPPSSTCISKATSMLDAKIYMGSTEAILLPAFGAAAGCSTLSSKGSSAFELANAAVGLDHPTFGMPLQEALLGMASSKGPMMFGTAIAVESYHKHKIKLCYVSW